MVVFICVALRLANKNLNRCDAAPHGTLRCEVRDTLKRFNFYDCPTPPSSLLLVTLFPKFMQLEIDIIQF